jgi:hypothetical protein
MPGESLQPLELAVIQMLLHCDHLSLIALRAQLEHLAVISRKMTCVGFLTRFALRPAAVPAPVPSTSIRFGDVFVPPVSGLQFGAG